VDVDRGPILSRRVGTRFYDASSKFLSPPPANSRTGILPLTISNMATTTQIRLRGRPAHTAGPTYLSYTPDGTKVRTCPCFHNHSGALSARWLLDIGSQMFLLHEVIN
jgi:hypothetical protein